MTHSETGSEAAEKFNKVPNVLSSERSNAVGVSGPAPKRKDIGKILSSSSSQASPEHGGVRSPEKTKAGAPPASKDEAGGRRAVGKRGVPGQYLTSLGEPAKQSPGV